MNGAAPGALDEARIERIVRAVRFDERGLVPAVVTQHDSGEVLMLAYLNAEALRITLRERRVTYWSRSRGELWRKGATSGNTQRLMGLAMDCDADTLHLRVEQRGPACHTGSRSCFDGDPLAVRFADGRTSVSPGEAETAS